MTRTAARCALPGSSATAIQCSSRSSTNRSGSCKCTSTGSCRAPQATSCTQARTALSMRRFRSASPAGRAASARTSLAHRRSARRASPATTRLLRTARRACSAQSTPSGLAPPGTRASRAPFAPSTRLLGALPVPCRRMLACAMMASTRRKSAVCSLACSAQWGLCAPTRSACSRATAASFARMITRSPAALFGRRLRAPARASTPCSRVPRAT
mmetsp:Transcript_66369/g.163515  ORF Transcript_66369/g.163515 Transcript_66369/m.163515 type:complete len:214 (+) Transcript_66369:284-925(+)